MWPLRTMSFFALFVMLCALTLVYPIVGIVNYLMIYQVNPTTSWWGKPLANLGIRFSMTAAVFLLLGLIINWNRLPKVRPLICTWQALAIGMMVIAAISRLLGVEIADWPTEIMLEKFIKLMIFVLCLTCVVTDRKSFTILLWSLVMGALVLGYDAYTAPQWQFIRGRLNDVGGPDFRASSGLAAHMASMLPLIGVAALTSKSWRWRLLALMSGAFAVNTIVLCRTRSAFVGLIVGAAAAVLLAPRRRRVVVYAAILVAGVSSYALTDHYFWNRMATLRDDEYMAQDAATTLRMRVWAAALVMFADHPEGVGCGNFPRVIGRYDDSVKYRGSHNTFILCITEFGIQGAVVFFLLILCSFAQLREVRRLAGRSRDPPATALAIYGIGLSMIVYLAVGMFTERFYTESFWWVLALPTCFQRAVRREVAETGLEPALALEAQAVQDWGAVPAPAAG